jgi:superfamily II DNA/RNA helicase
VEEKAIMTKTSPTGATGFRALGVPADLCAALAADDITEPFEIQTACVPDALAGKDLCGRAATGSGKTLAFGIPMLTRVSQAKPFHPTGIVLVPTRELAKQVRFDLLSMGKERRRYILAVYGGTAYGSQLNSFRMGASILVACPGRLLDFVRRGQLSLDSVEVCVVDEADRLADLGFMDDVRELLDAMPAKRQTLLFSATLDGDVDELIKNYQHDPVMVDLIGDEPDASPATHYLKVVRPIEKTGVAANLIRDYGRTVVFVKTREGADSVRESLEASGIRAGSIHGGMGQGQRERSLEAFRHGRVDALVATDVAARGIHVDGVELVLHWDIAMDPKDYVHRSGRTARAGSAGTVISLVTDRQAQRASRITKLAGIMVEKLGNESSGRRPQGPIHADRETAAAQVLEDYDEQPGQSDDTAPVRATRPGQHGGVRTVAQLAGRPQGRGPRVRSRRPS